MIEYADFIISALLMRARLDSEDFEAALDQLEVDEDGSIPAEVRSIFFHWCFLLKGHTIVAH